MWFPEFMKDVGKHSGRLVVKGTRLPMLKRERKKKTLTQQLEFHIHLQVHDAKN